MPGQNCQIESQNMSLKPLTHLRLKALTTKGILWRGLLVCCETKKEGKKREKRKTIEFRAQSKWTIKDYGLTLPLLSLA